MNLDVAVLQGMKPSGCACPGDILTYKCIIMGTYFGVTVWTGSAFMSNCEITLLHIRFPSVADECNNGAIVGRSLSVEDNNYTSQLNIIVTPDIAGKTIECGQDDESGFIIYHSSVLPSSGLPSCNSIDVGTAR